MQLKEKAAYLKGLMEGLAIDDSTKEGKVLLAMQGLLEEICDAVSTIDDDLDQVYDELDAMDADMDDLEEVVFGDEYDEEEDEDDEDGVRYELTCPNCGAVTVVDEDTLLREEIACQNCGAAFDIEFGECDGDCDACAEADEDEGEE